MKKIMMTLVAAAMATTMNAQWYIGGGLGVGFDKTATPTTAVVNNLPVTVETTVKTTTFSILPEIGYNINEKFAVGAQLGYDYSKVEDKKTNGFTFAPYLRYTFAKLEKVNFFCDLGLAYTYKKTTWKDTEYDATLGAYAVDYSTKRNGFSVGLYPGVAVNLNEKVSFVAKFGALSYVYSKVKDGGKDSSFNFGVDGSDLQFGLYYNF